LRVRNETVIHFLFREFMICLRCQIWAYVNEIFIKGFGNKFRVGGVTIINRDFCNIVGFIILSSKNLFIATSFFSNHFVL
jgi:hypothetical protein